MHSGPERSSRGSPARKLLFLAAGAPQKLPSTCPRQPGHRFPSKHSRAQPRSPTVAAPLACLSAGKIGRSSQVQAVQGPPWAAAGRESHAGYQDSPAAERRVQEACSGRSKSPWYSRLPWAPLLPEWAGALRVRKLLSTAPPPSLPCRHRLFPACRVRPSLPRVSLADPSRVRPLLLDPAPAHPLFRPRPPYSSSPPPSPSG